MASQNLSRLANSSLRRSLLRAVCSLGLGDKQYRKACLRNTIGSIAQDTLILFGCASVSGIGDHCPHTPEPTMALEDTILNGFEPSHCYHNK